MSIACVCDVHAWHDQPVRQIACCASVHTCLVHATYMFVHASCMLADVLHMLQCIFYMLEHDLVCFPASFPASFVTLVHGCMLATSRTTVAFATIVPGNSFIRIASRRIASSRVASRRISFKTGNLRR